MNTNHRDRLFIAAFLAFLLASTTANAGITALFALDETAGSGDPALNSIGGDNGTLINASRITQGASGIFGTAYDFQPTTNGGGINLGTAAAVRPTDDFTISFWFQTDVSGPFDRLLESMDGVSGTSKGIRLDLGGAGNKLRALLRDGSGNTNSKEHSTPLSAGTWYFAAVRYDKDDQLQLTLVPEQPTIDSTAIGAATETQAPLIGALTYGATYPAMLGVENAGGSAVNALDGRLDDFAFYDEVLSNQQLATAYNLGAMNAVVPTPFLGWNAVDGPASGNWQPSAGSGYSWNLSNAGAAAPDLMPMANGRGKAYRYDGDENVQFSGPSFASLGPADSASFEMLFRPESLSGGKQVLWETGGVNGSSLTLNGNQLRFGTASSGNGPNAIGLVYTMSDTTGFTHVVGVVDRETGETRMYVNGTPVASQANTTSNWSGDNTAGLGTIQGGATGGFADAGTAGVATQEGGTPGLYGTFQGDLAVFNFYQRALSDGQAAVIHQAMPPAAMPITFGLTLNWIASDPGSNPADQWQPNVAPSAADTINYDLSGATAKPVLVAVASDIAIIDAAYEFAGGDGKAAASTMFTQLSGGNAATQDMTIELWLKPDDLVGKEVLWEAGGSGSGSSIRLDGDQLIFRVKNGATTEEASATLSAAGSTLGAWGGGEGDAVGSLNVVQIGGTTLPSGGDLETAGFGTFDGQIAIMRFYRNMALTGPEVALNYSAVAVYPSRRRACSSSSDWPCCRPSGDDAGRI